LQYRTALREIGRGILTDTSTTGNQPSILLLDSVHGLWNKIGTFWIIQSCVWDRHIMLRGAGKLAPWLQLSVRAGMPRR
jgi:hypothetical protein